jgi:protein-disulfide isomerase
MSEITLTLKNPPIKTDHHKGPLEASIIIVEYGDYECPRSAAMVPILDKIFKSYIDVCLIFRHLPLVSSHPHSAVAAVAAEAAAQQNKFWEMHQALFENQSDLSTENILSIARDLKLNMRKFVNDLENEKLLKKVRVDLNNGINNGIKVTPTIFVNGIRFEGIPSYEEIREEIKHI